MQVEIYGTSWCVSCQQSKKLCDVKGIVYTYTDVDDTASLRQLEERLGCKVKAVPQIFVDGEHIPGGFTGLQQVLNSSIRTI